MGKTSIQVGCLDQRLVLSSAPLIASGGRNEIEVLFTFCPLWEGFQKVASFWRDEKNVFHVVIEGDECVIPWEVLADEGEFYFSVFGVKDDIVRTSNIVKYKLVKGAITEATEISDPTPEIYQQILESYRNMLKQMEEHGHGNVTNDGKMGTVAGRIITTGENGMMEASTPEEAREKLRLDETIDHSVTADGTNPVSGKAVHDYAFPKAGGTLNGRLTVDASAYGLGSGLVIEKGETSTTFQNTDAHAAMIWRSPEFNAGNSVLINNEGVELGRGHPVAGNESNECVATTKAVAEYVASVIGDNTSGGNNSGDNSGVDLPGHASDQNNPHNVTAAQVGAAPERHTHQMSDVVGLATLNTRLNTLEQSALTDDDKQDIVNDALAALAGADSSDATIANLQSRTTTLETKVANHAVDIVELQAGFDELEIWLVEHMMKVFMRLVHIERHLNLTPPANDDFDTSSEIDEQYDALFGQG